MSYLRYSKHIELSGFGESGQKQITQSRIAIIGLGGLGSPALQYLAGAGIGKIILCDDDNVSLDNLHRQTIYSEQDVGLKKSECAKAYIKNLNSSVDVEIVSQAVDTDNVEGLVKECDLVLDCTDNFRARYLINDACYLNSVPLVTGAVTFTGGYCVFFDFSKLDSDTPPPCYRCLYSEIDNSKRTIPTCSDSSVLGPSAGIVGCFMASEAIKHLSGYKKGQQTTMTTLDMKFNQFSSLEVSKNVGCILCGQENKIKRIEKENYEITWRQTCQIAV